MTDLERLWKRLDVGPAPVDDLVREGRERAAAESAELVDGGRPSSGVSARRRFVTRPLLTAAAVTALVSAFVGGTLASGDRDGSRSGGPGGDASPVGAFQADVTPASSCDDLLASYQERARGLVTAWGWENRSPYRGGLLDGGIAGDSTMSRMDGLRAPLDAEAGYAADDAPATERSTSSGTGTNVQEEGVDEPDVVKTDGELLVRVRGDELVVYDVTGRETRRTASLDLELDEAELLLAGDTVVALGRVPDERDTAVVTVDVADPADPQVSDTATYASSLLSARQHGDDVRLVLSSGLPDLDFTEPGDGTSLREAREANEQVVAESSVDDWLPTVADDDAEPSRLLDCTAVGVPDEEVGLDTVSVVGFRAGAPSELDAVGLAGAADIAYESTDHLYLASSPATAGCFDCFGDGVGSGSTTGSTYLFDFALDGTSATHVASGEVEGSVADRWAMDEQEGVLRLAVGETAETGPFNSVVTLERRGPWLGEVGRLDRLGVGEDIESVRWFDDLAVVVTFEQVDPLYTVDLTDQRAPRLLGKLKIPGFSEYLHPLGSKRLLGVGEGPQPGGRWGGQAGLFDVTDLTDVQQLDVVGFGGSSRALAGADPRQFTWLPAERTALTVVSTRYGRTGWVVALRMDDGQITQTRQQVEYGSDVADVRTVPLPDGRVVLLTGEDARFLDY